jgi:cytochrome c nitrite reductase small subunit
VSAAAGPGTPTIDCREAGSSPSWRSPAEPGLSPLTDPSILRHDAPVAIANPGGNRTAPAGADLLAPLLVLSTAIGITVGLGAYTFVYARGFSYLTDRPEACANCHVMRAHYDAWLKSSHRAVAVCNDCHTPAGFLAKYRTKMLNGLHHSYAFTSGDYPDPIRIKAANRAVAEAACRKCHDEMVQAIFGTQGDGQGPSCIRCHEGVGHAE